MRLEVSAKCIKIAKDLSDTIFILLWKQKDMLYIGKVQQSNWCMWKKQQHAFAPPFCKTPIKIYD